MDLTTQLSRLDFEPDGAATVESVAELERLVGVALPDAYRRFMLSTGGGELRACAKCTQPTPFGDHNINVLHSIDDVIGLLDSSVAPRNMICVGYGNFGATSCLSVAGLDHGHVYSLDTEMRYFWDMERVHQMFPDLDATAARFFELRNAEALPDRPWGYENCYHIADDFDQFMMRLKSDDP